MKIINGVNLELKRVEDLEQGSVFVFLTNNLAFKDRVFIMTDELDIVDLEDGTIFHLTNDDDTKECEYDMVLDTTPVKEVATELFISENEE